MKYFPAAALIAACCIAAPADAQQRHRIAIPPGQLASAIVLLGRQSGASIGISDPVLARRRTGAISGTMTAREALRLLLVDLPARIEEIDSTTFRIVPAAQERNAGARSAPRRARQVAAPSETPPPAPLAEIVVTGSRRDVPLRSFPGTVEIVMGDDPMVPGVEGTQALVARLPTLASTHLGPGRNKLFVRGVADSSFQGPTQAVTGQYLGETRINFNAPDPDLRLPDVARIEVLAGPQGTLYGAGSMSGIVRIVPAAPDPDAATASAAAAVSLTRHGDPGADASAVINLPLATGSSALRVSGYGVREGGYIDDLQRGEADVNRVTVAGGRLAVRTLAGADWQLDGAITGQRIRSRDAQYADEDAGRLARRASIREGSSSSFILGDVVATRELGERRLVATLGYARQELDERYDATAPGNPTAIYDLGTSTSFLSAEVRLLDGSSRATGSILGASLIANRTRQTREVDAGGLRYVRGRVADRIVEGALFAERAVRLGQGVVLTAGGRVSLTSLSSSGQIGVPGSPLPERPSSATRTQARFLPALAVAMDLSPDLTAYARYQQSFRSGGQTIAGEEVTRVRGDKIASIEGGIRTGAESSSGFSGRAALAFTRWSNVQADVLDNRAEPTTANIGDGRVLTLDAEGTWRPLTGLRIEAAATANRSRISNLAPGILFDPSAPLPNIAPLGARLGASYERMLVGGTRLSLAAAARYTGPSRLGIGIILGKRQEDWVDVRAAVRIERGRHAISLTGTNLLDSAAPRFALGTPFLLDEEVQAVPPRPATIRLGCEVAF